MSVLIKGMDMPKEHEIIKCYIVPYKDHAQLIVTNSNVPEVYDAIEVPTPHGDLIDRDKLLSDIDHYHVSNGIFQHLTQVQNAVIESEE